MFGGELELSILNSGATLVMGAVAAAMAAIVAACDAVGLVRLPRGVRPALFGLSAMTGLVVGVAFGTGALRSPDRAEPTLAAASGSDARGGVDRETTGSVPTGTVFIQVPDMDARFAAASLSRALTAAGFRSPGIDVVGDGAPSRPEVRYFNPGDRRVADRVAGIVDNQGLKGARVREMSTYKAPPGQIELWYPAE